MCDVFDSWLCLVADILILGVGDYEEIPKLNRNVIKHLHSHKISVEVLATVLPLFYCNSNNNKSAQSNLGRGPCCSGLWPVCVAKTQFWPCGLGSAPWRVSV